MLYRLKYSACLLFKILPELVSLIYLDNSQQQISIAGMDNPLISALYFIFKVHV